MPKVVDAMTVVKNFPVVMVPAGRYFLGDPCYAVPDKQWGALLDSCKYFDLPIGHIGEHQVLAFPTAYGDGTYSDQDGTEYAVDAGLIGLTPVALCGEGITGGRYVDFARNIECKNTDFVLHFGRYRINTAD